MHVVDTGSLQNLIFTILNKHGKENVVANFLSRLTSNENDPPIEDSFPNENLLSISTDSPWFTDIANYLAIWKLPSYLSPREKRNVIQISASYSWINEELYKTGPNLVI